MDVQALIKELGPMKYHFKTRIGNWSEEWELEETKYLLPSLSLLTHA